MNASTPRTTHAMTIDVEDYYHVAAFAKVIQTSEWERYPSRVVANTQQLLALFERKGMQATFFVLGWVAERYPELVREIDRQGHEIASHGYSHQLVYGQTPEVFREETHKSKQLLEQLVQKPCDGYRAASYSITAQSLWALDILAELGFKWDSSIFPIRHDRYGMPNSPEAPYRIRLKSGRELVEFPLTTANVAGMSVPAAGGGYFRQYPYFLSKWLFRRASLNETRPQIFYLHPWEIDTQQPRIANASWFSRFRHYTNIDKCQPRLERLIDDFRFGTMSQSLAQLKIEQVLDAGQLV